MTEEEQKRYSRHLLLEEIGEEGQEKLTAARVLIVGTGGLGSPVALYLAGAGVGTIGIIDGDVVDYSNLQRQVIHTTKDIDRPKVLSAREKMLSLNPHINVITYYELLTEDNAAGIISQYDFVVDCTDNFDVKFLINDVCVRIGKPFSHGSILRFEGQTFTYLPESIKGGCACYRCLYGAPPPPGVVPKASEAGVLGAIAGMLGTIQAAEVLKYITGAGALLTNTLLTFDAKTMDFNKIQFFRNSECKAHQ